MDDFSITTVEDVIKWLYNHDGIIETRWDNQFKTNTEFRDLLAKLSADVALVVARTTSNHGEVERHETAIVGIFKRMTAMEKKVMYLAGGASAIGACVGAGFGVLAALTVLGGG